MMKRMRSRSRETLSETGKKVLLYQRFSIVGTAAFLFGSFVVSRLLFMIQ